MKITKKQLKQIIKEELEKVIGEKAEVDPRTTSWYGSAHAAGVASTKADWGFEDWYKDKVLPTRGEHPPSEKRQAELRDAFEAGVAKSKKDQKPAPGGWQKQRTTDQWGQPEQGYDKFMQDE